MNETDAERRELQELLDRSAAGPKRHLTDIATEAWRLSAEQLTDDLRGALVLDVATVTAAGEPRLSAVDGHFLHGRWHFSTASSALKTRHLTRRPWISAAHTPRDGYGVWVHGRAERLDGDEAAGINRFLSAYYGMDLDDMADGIEIFRIDPHWMLGFAMPPEQLGEFAEDVTRRAGRLDGALAALG